MLEIHTTKRIGPDSPDNQRRAGCYKSKEGIVKGMETCLESIGIVRTLIEGLEAEGFINDRVVVERCAINLIVVGNQIGMLDPQLQFNNAMKTAYDVRSIIAHQYGTSSFSKSTFWKNIKDDLDYLENGCRQVIEIVRTEEIQFVSPNKKFRWFRFRFEAVHHCKSVNREVFRICVRLQFGVYPRAVQRIQVRLLLQKIQITITLGNSRSGQMTMLLRTWIRIKDTGRSI